MPKVALIRCLLPSVLALAGVPSGVLFVHRAALPAIGKALQYMIDDGIFTSKLLDLLNIC